MLLKPKPILALAVSGLLTAPALAINYDVYMAAGQSNMDGRGLKSDLTGSLASYAGPQNDVKLYYDNPVAASSYTPSWVSLQPGYSVPGTNLPVPGNDFGPELGFGRAMQNAAAAGHTVAIVKVSQGSTNLGSDWNPNATSGKQLFKLLIADTKAAIASLAGPGDTVTIRGMIWHQGESDSGNTTQAAYAAELTDFINAVRSSSTGVGVPNLPFVVGQIEVDDANHGTNIPNAQKQVGTQSGFYTGFASSSGLVTAEGTHFIASSQIQLGQRFSTALQGIVPEPTGLTVVAAGGTLLTRRRRKNRNFQED